MTVMSAQQAVGGAADKDQRPGSGEVLQRAARSTALSFAGAMISGLAGFGLSLILGRMIGPEGNGIVFQMISVFMIASAFAKLGLDTTCVWLLPRLSLDDRNDVRRATWMLLGGAVAGGLVAGVVVFLLAPFLSGGHPELLSLLQLGALFVPVASLSTVALAATRGLGGIRPYVLIGSIGLPTARLAGVAIALAFAASALIAGLVWLTVLLIAVIFSLIAVGRRLRPYDGASGPARQRRVLARQISAYSVPRLAASIMEQSILWMDVLIVGLIAGPAAAGVYGVVSRLAQAGFIPSTSMRIVVAPQFSRMLHQNHLPELADFYARTTQWITLMSTPVYVIFIIQPKPILGIFGDGFSEGALALVIASIGAVIWTSAGNVQSLLLMSGRSGWAALNKLIVLLVALTLLLTLVPSWGVEGAALAWSISMVLDAALAILVTRLAVRVRAHPGGTLLAFVCAGVSTAIPVLLSRLLLGDTIIAVAVGVVGAGVLYVGVLYLLRERFALHYALTVFARRKSKPI